MAPGLLPDFDFAVFSDFALAAFSVFPQPMAVVIKQVEKSHTLIAFGDKQG